MRASRSLSARLAKLGTAVAIAAGGFAGVALVGTASPTGASTPTGTTVCALSAPAGSTPITASIAASISPNPVPAGDTYSVTGLTLTSTLVANAITSAGAGKTLSVSFTTNLDSTGATPAKAPVVFSGAVTLPNPFPVGASAPVSLTAPNVSFTSDASGATSTTVAFDPSGSLSVALGSLDFSGACTGPPPVVVASAPITPAAATIARLIPNAGVGVGGTQVKIVGNHLSGITSVTFGGVAATDIQNPSPNVIICTAPALPGFSYGAGNTVTPENVVVTTAAGSSVVGPNDTFTYVDPTLGAIVSGVSPAAGVTAGGNQVTITGYGFDDLTDGGGIGGPASGVDFGTVAATSFTVNSNTSITATVPAGTGIVDVTVIGYDGSTPSPISPADRYNYNPGYFLTGSDGGIFSFGQVAGHAGFFGSAGDIKLNQPIVGMSTTPDGGGYWLVASDGGVFAYGDAPFWGSAGNLTLNKPIVGIASTPDGEGYWLVASDGGVFAYGDALFYGSAGNLTLNKPIVGIAATADGKGYWMVASDGGVFAYGDAAFHGSAGNLTLAKPVVGMSADPNGGYWLVASDGGVFAYDAPFYGSLAGTSLAAPVSGIASTGDGLGYWLTGQSGGVFNKGDAGFYGDMAGITLNGPLVGFAPVQSTAVAPVATPTPV